MPGSHRRSIFGFLRNRHTVLYHNLTSLQSHPKCGKDLFFPHPLQCLLFSIFFFWILYDSHSNWSMVKASSWFLFGFHKLLVNWAFFFPYAFWPSEFHLLKNSCSFTFPIFKLDFFFTLLSVLNTLQILDINSLLVM